ncbi:hypothetical protein TNCV_2984271 [Trichonephila clavipes]|nr:hypothetical protein TNCV_2984271 [Trichonephila clavipes]
MEMKLSLVYMCLNMLSGERVSVEDDEPTGHPSYILLKRTHFNSVEVQAFQKPRSRTVTSYESTKCRSV